MKQNKNNLQSLRDTYLPQAVFQLTQINLKRAKGALLWDTSGKEYIDFVGGIGCVNAGHCPDEVIKAIQEQAAQYIQPSINVMNYEPYLKLIQKLCEITPGEKLKQAVLFNSGAEAVENAIKIARYATKRSAVLCFDGAFHGRTLLAMSLTSKVKPYKSGFGPYASEIYRIPHPGLTPIHDMNAYWQHIFTSLIDAEQIAAIIFEPELGEGGFIPMPKAFVKHLRNLCTEKGIVMIADEIQTGFCRTGKGFAMEHYELAPDLITLGKSLASGMPLTAVVGDKALMSAAHVGGIGGTFCGNPLSCAAALESIKLYESQNLSQRADEIGKRTKAFFLQMKEKYPCIGSVHGFGAMVGVEFVDKSGYAAPVLLKKLMALALENGLILMSSGMQGNVLRTLMPLVISDEELVRAFAAIEASLKGLNTI